MLTCRLADLTQLARITDGQLRLLTTMTMHNRAFELFVNELALIGPIELLFKRTN